jgi:hypothetical protein
MMNAKNQQINESRLNYNDRKIRANSKEIICKI